MSESDRPGAVTLRPATRDDAALIVELIEELARYERLRDRCRADRARIETHLFGPRPYAEAILADLGGAPAGLALFFHTFSTFECAPSLYLEDLYVRPRYRGRGVGGGLLRRLAALALERGCRRMEWAVLDWNEPAIAFYRRLGATPLHDWTTYRLDGPALDALAGSAT